MIIVKVSNHLWKVGMKNGETEGEFPQATVGLCLKVRLVRE